MEQTLRQPSGSPLLGECPPTLPARFYYDAAHHGLEEQLIWRRHWIYAGRANDMAPMSVKRLSIAGQNLILIRKSADAFACFHNTCRHRGAELCAADQTRLKSKLITCPYHQWSYDLDGKLVRTPFVGLTPDFRAQDHGLFAVPVKVWNGFVFVCLAADPPPFERAPDLGVGALDSWPMADLVTGHRMVTEIACNWKIFWENFNECLHCPGIHPELCDLVPVYARGYMAPNEDPAYRPGHAAHHGPLRAGARSWTMNGKACGPEFPDLTAAEREAGHRFVTLMPTMFVVAHVDYARAVSLRPLGPTRTELTAEWLFPRATLEAPGFDLANVVDFASVVLRQDAAACEMNQRGLASERFTQGTLMPQEFDVHHFQQWVRQNLADAADTEPRHGN